MKHEYIIAVILALVGLLLVALTLGKYESVTTTSSTNVPVTATNTTASLTLPLVAQHQSAADCWLVIAGQVYDVTKYLIAHPGGLDVVLPFCGQPDATLAFEKKAGRGTHSPNAQTLLAQYLIGTLNEQPLTVATNTNIAAINTNATNTNTRPAVSSNPSNTSVTLTLAIISQHRSATDCWLVINGKVYDVSSYLRVHPGGIGVVAPFCGQPDASSAFQTKAGQGSHSASARALLGQYLIGSVNGSSSTNTITRVKTAPPPPVTDGQEGERDDD